MSDDNGGGLETSWANGDAVGPVVGTDGDTVVDERSFFQRLMDSIVGVLIGLVLIPASVWGLAWNEGRAVQMERALTEGAGIAISVSSDVVDAANDGKLVHVSGPARTTGPARDDMFAISAPGVRLVRKVEMYQWREERRTSNNQTTYSYTREWSERAISSANFRQQQGHQNPPMPFSSATLVAPGAQVGAFRLGDAAVGAIPSTANQAFPVTEAAFGAFRARFGTRARIVDGVVHLGDDPASPRVGDLRVTYNMLPIGALSFVARQEAGALTTHTARNGATYLLGAAGARSSAEMFETAQTQNQILTWFLRAIGLLVMAVGFMLIMGPFVTAMSWFPIIGTIAEVGAIAIALVMTALAGSTTIAIAWLVFRPLLAAGLIAAGLAIFYGVKVLADRRHAAKAAARHARMVAAGAMQPAYAGMPQPPIGGFAQLPQGLYVQPPVAPMGQASFLGGAALPPHGQQPAPDPNRPPASFLPPGSRR